MTAITDSRIDIVFTVEHADTTVRIVCAEDGSGIDIWTVVERIAGALVAVGFAPDQVLTAMETIRESDWASRFTLDENGREVQS